MLPRSNSVDIFTHQIKNYMNNDYVIVDYTQTIENAIKEIQSKKNQVFLLLKIISCAEF